MDYTRSSELLTSVQEEISRVAARSYTPEGLSLYDSIRATSRDDDTLNRMISDVLDTILARFRDFISSISDAAIVFNLPDLPAGFGSKISSELDRAITMGVVASWLEEKGIQESQSYANRFNAAMDKAELLMVTRKIE